MTITVSKARLVAALKLDSALAQLDLVTDAEITLNEKRDDEFLELIG